MKLLREENMTAGQSGYGDNIAGINLIRLPEMYLIAAEALLEKEPEVALEYFDTFIATRGLMKFKDRGQKLTLEDIDKERKKEFFGEGQEFYNMKREMRDVYLTASTEFEFRYDGNGEDNIEQK